MKVRRSQLKDQATVATYGGEGSSGASYADGVTVWCAVDETRRLVRDQSGDEAVSEATLILHPQTRTIPADVAQLPAVVDPLELFTAESQVTIRGRTTNVLTAKAHTDRGRTAYVEVTCA